MIRLVSFYCRFAHCQCARTQTAHTLLHSLIIFAFMGARNNTTARCCAVCTRANGARIRARHTFCFHKWGLSSTFLSLSPALALSFSHLWNMHTRVCTHYPLHIRTICVQHYEAPTKTTTTTRTEDWRKRTNGHGRKTRRNERKRRDKNRRQTKRNEQTENGKKTKKIWTKIERMCERERETAGSDRGEMRFIITRIASLITFR